MIVRCPFSPHLSSLYPTHPKKKELTAVLLVLALAPDRDALFEATAFLNPPMTIFDATSDAARFTAAETAGLACDPLDRFAKISGRDWKYLYKKKRNKLRSLFDKRGGTKRSFLIHPYKRTYSSNKEKKASFSCACRLENTISDYVEFNVTMVVVCNHQMHQRPTSITPSAKTPRSSHINI